MIKQGGMVTAFGINQVHPHAFRTFNINFYYRPLVLTLQYVSIEINNMQSVIDPMGFEEHCYSTGEASTHAIVMLQLA